MAGADKYSEMVSAYLEGELTNEELCEFEHHLSTCTECRQVLNMYTAMSAALNDLDESPDADFSTNVMSIIQTEICPKPIKSKKNSIIKWFAATAAVLVVIAGFLFIPRSNSSESDLSIQRSVLESAESEDNPSLIVPEKRSASGSSEAQYDSSSAVPEDSLSDSSQAQLQEYNDSVELFSGSISDDKTSVIVSKDNISSLFILSVEPVEMPEDEPTVTVRINTESDPEDYPVWVQDDAVLVLYTDGQTYTSEISPDTMAQVLADAGFSK